MVDQYSPALDSFVFDDDEIEAVVATFGVRDPWDHEAEELAAVCETLRTLKDRIRGHHLLRHDSNCCYCKMPLDGGGRYMVDREHILPKRPFGHLAYAIFNLSAACKRCNMEMKGQRLDFIVNRIAVGADPENEAHYRFIHPNFDLWSDHLKRYVVQENSAKLIKYVVVPNSRKGAYTVDFFQLKELEVDSFDVAQGKAPIDAEQMAWVRKIRAMT